MRKYILKLFLILAVFALASCKSQDKTSDSTNDIENTLTSATTVMTEEVSINDLQTDTNNTGSTTLTIKTLNLDSKDICNSKIEEINNSSDIKDVIVKLNSDELLKIKELSQIKETITKDITINVTKDDVLEAELFNNLKGEVILRISGGLPVINDIESLSDKLIIYLDVKTNDFDRLSLYTNNFNDIQGINITYNPFGKVDLYCLYNIKSNKYSDWDKWYPRVYANGNVVINTGWPCDSTICYDFYNIENIDKIPQDKIKALIDETGYRLKNVTVDDYDNDGSFEGIVTLESSRENACGIVIYESWIVSKDKTARLEPEDGEVCNVITMKDGTKVIAFYYVGNAYRTSRYDLYTLEDADNAVIKSQVDCDGYSLGEYSDFVLYNRYFVYQYIGSGIYSYFDIIDGCFYEYKPKDITEEEFCKINDGQNVLADLRQKYKVIQIQKRDNGIMTVILESDETYEDLYTNEIKNMNYYMDYYNENGKLTPLFESPVAGGECC